MALTLKASNGFVSRIRALFKLQRFSHAIVDGGLQPQFHRDMGSDSNSIPEQCQIDMSKWKKLDSRTFGITRSMISSASWVVLKLLQREGFEAYLVGGCVRDLILNKTPKDFDVITTAKLKQIKKRFRRAQIVGRRFPICRVHVKGSVIEVSSFETVAKHGEEKEKVSFSQMPSGCDESDFNRWRNCMHRDFTINSLFFDPFVNKIYDYANGMKDLRSLKLRTLIPAQLSFKEDCARMLRGLRIAARLGLSFSRETETAIRSLASSVKSLDKSRIMLELNYMLSYGSAKPSLCLLWRFNLLDILLPFHGAYLAQQATEPSAQHSMMFMKLFFNLDKLVTCDRPCDCSLWVGLLAFHMALVNKPQDASVVWTLSSVLYHGKWTEGVKFARKHALAPISFSPEILVECDSKSDEELAERVSELASLVQDCAISSTKTGDLSASMSDYPDYPCTGLVFVQKRMAERVAHIFNVLVNGIESYKEGRGSPEIDYYLLGKGDLRETRFVLGKVIMDTMSSGLVQMGTEVLEEKNQLHMSYNEQKPEALEQDCHPILYEVVKHLVVAKEDKKCSLSSFNPELQQERGKKQKLVDIEFDPLEQEIAKEKQKEKNNKHQEIAKKQEMAENEQHQEMAKKHLKMVGKENLQKSAKRQDKVAKNSHLPQQKLARKQNEQHKLEEAVNQKPSRPSLSSLFKSTTKGHVIFPTSSLNYCEHSAHSDGSITWKVPEMGNKKVVLETRQNRRALSVISENVVRGGVSKRGLLEKQAICEKRIHAPVQRRPVTRRFAAQLASRQHSNIVEPKKPELLSIWTPGQSEDCEIEDMEEHKAAPDHPVPMLVEQTETKIDEMNQVEEVEMEDIDGEPIMDIDGPDARNPLAVAEYVEELYAYYRRMESSSCVSPDYMAQQFDINHKMRAILIDWLIEVHDKFELMEETLFLTVNLVDRFLAQQTVARKKLQLVGLVAMLLACKYEEVSVPVVADLIIISDKAYTRKEFLEMERLMLNTLQFNMSVPTPYVFMKRFLKAAQSDKKMELLSFFLMDVCLVEYEMLKFPPSLLAAASIYTAQCTLYGFKQWDKTCEHYTSYTEDQLLECSRLIVNLHQNVGSGKLTAAQRKYCTSKLGYTSKCEPAHFLLGTQQQQ